MVTLLPSSVGQSNHCITPDSRLGEADSSSGRRSRKFMLQKSRWDGDTAASTSGKYNLLWLVTGSAFLSPSSLWDGGRSLHLPSSRFSYQYRKRIDEMYQKTFQLLRFCVQGKVGEHICSIWHGLKSPPLTNQLTLILTLHFLSPETFPLSSESEKTPLFPSYQPGQVTLSRSIGSVLDFPFSDLPRLEQDSLRYPSGQMQAGAPWIFSAVRETSLIRPARATQERSKNH